MRLFVSLLILLLLMPLAQAQSFDEILQECPGVLLQSGSDPQQIHLQMTDDPTEMTVIWATRVDSQSQKLQWNNGTYADGNSNDGAYHEIDAESYCYGNHNMAFHMATMTELPLGEEIFYRVGYGTDPDADTWSDLYNFTTIDPSANHFQWISIADHGDSSEGMDVSEAIIADTAAQMVTISGDISYADGEQSSWDNWFNFQQDSMTNIPWVTAVGNHENEPGYEFAPYEHRFDSDQQIESETFWYSRNVPGVHMVFMSTEHDYSAGSTQYSWLEQDLSSVNRDVTPFVIVYGHKPMYSSNSYHGSEVELRAALETMYVEQGVDLVIAGHDHFYERTWPVNAEHIIDKGVEGVLFERGHAPIHLVIGIAGRSAYEELVEPPPEWSAYRENNSYGWTRFAYDDETRQLSFTHHRINGTIGDFFIIQERSLIQETKDSGGFGLPGFDAIIPIIAMLGAAVHRRLIPYDSVVGSHPDM